MRAAVPIPMLAATLMPKITAKVCEFGRRSGILSQSENTGDWGVDAVINVC